MCLSFAGGNLWCRGDLVSTLNIASALPSDGTTNRLLLNVSLDARSKGHEHPHTPLGMCTTLGIALVQRPSALNAAQRAQENIISHRSHEDVRQWERDNVIADTDRLPRLLQGAETTYNAKVGRRAWSTIVAWAYAYEHLRADDAATLMILAQHTPLLSVDTYSLTKHDVFPSRFMSSLNQVDGARRTGRRRLWKWR